MHIFPAAMLGLCLCTVLLVLTGPKRTPARLYLSALLTTIAAGHLAHALLPPATGLPLWLMPWMGLRIFFYGPLLFLFAAHAANPGRPVSWLDALHFAPILLVALVGPLLSGPPPALEDGALPRPPLWPGFAQAISVAAYTFAAWLHIRDALADPLMDRGETRMPATAGLEITLLVFLGVWLAQHALFLLAERPGPDSLLPALRGALLLSYTVPICFIGARMFFASVPRSTDTAASQKVERSEKVDESSEHSASLNKYQRSGLKPEQAAELWEAITHYMENQRPYLDADFGPGDLAAALDVPRTHVSQAINQELNENFYNFINKYRVDAVVEKILRNRDEPLNLLQLALNAGFNSKSTFNSAFKRITGRTPSEFKGELGKKEIVPA